MSRFCILGEGGQLGEAFAQLLRNRGDDFVLLGENQVDLAKPEAIELSLNRDDTLINCAAYTQVDTAETNEELANRINGEAVGRLAELAAQNGARFVHYSTDYVFNGRASSPYPVDHPHDPVNAYGRSKALGEKLALKNHPDCLLIRTSWVYAPWGNNFVKTMARLMREKDSLRVVDDQRGRPTHALGLAERTLGLLDRNETGIFHITDEGECSWFEFARAIAEAIGAKCDIAPCTTEEFPRPAPRPAYSVLSLDKAEAVLGPGRHFRDWLGDMAKQGL